MNTHTYAAERVADIRWMVWGTVLAGVLALAGAAHVAFADAHIAAGAAHYRASLTGDAEVPPVTTMATGTLLLAMHPTSTPVVGTTTPPSATTTATTTGAFRLDVFDGTGITAAHLHCAPQGENGPIVVTLFSAGAPTMSPTTTMATSTDVNGALSTGSFIQRDIEPTGATCDTPITTMAQLITAIEDGDIYVNVHSTSSPAGLIRGQVESDSQTPDGSDGDNGNGRDDDVDEIVERIRAQIDEIRTHLDARLEEIRERIREIHDRLNIIRVQ